MHFRYFIIISLGKGCDPLFEQICIPLTQGYFVPSLVEIGPMVLEKKMKMWKVYDNYNDANDNGQRKNCDQKSSLEPKSTRFSAKHTIILGILYTSILHWARIGPFYYDHCSLWSRLTHKRLVVVLNRWLASKNTIGGLTLPRWWWVNRLLVRIMEDT